MKRIVTGILAHVDAGKTTCIESMLYTSKTIRKLGRVDHQDAYLDYDNQERERGITIYSKEAHFHWKDSEIYLIDTPGHVDFSSEMERSLQVLDLAILLINGQDGIQSHTSTIWKCLKHYKIPTLIFINKMDISYKTKEELMNDLKMHFSSNCIDFKCKDAEDELSMLNEDIMNQYLETEEIDTSLLQQAIFKRECFPVFFGSALKIQGIEDLMDAITNLSFTQEYSKDFGARVYKISSDDQGNRLTHVKITGGVLNAKDKIDSDEKVDQIRLYNGKQFEMIQTAYPGMICALKGLNNYEIGQGLGFESDTTKPLLNAYMNYQLLLPDGVDALTMMRYCSVLAQEDPQLQIEYDEQTKQIFLRLMGSIQMEILQKEIEKRSKVKVGFTTGKVLFKETIQDTVIGVGHFEPLRHYAEVHLKLEPLPRGKGLVFESNCSNDELALNWQNLILTHLKEKQHKGVLTGSPITDMKITLKAGRAHQKHTEGGDFRQATYRAVRQGLRMAEAKDGVQLLEPWYDFTLELPADALGRAMADVQRMCGSFEAPETSGGTVRLTGRLPVATARGYAREVAAYTHGLGRWAVLPAGYDACHNADEIVSAAGYDPDADVENPADSVFCAHGAGYLVKWDEVPARAHVSSGLERRLGAAPAAGQTQEEDEANARRRRASAYCGTLEQDKELLAIFERTYGKIKRRGGVDDAKKAARAALHTAPAASVPAAPVPAGPDYLLVDGYNVIFAWDALRRLADGSLDAARRRLMDILCNYAGYKRCVPILVFDAYKVRGGTREVEKYHNLYVVYTREAETADMYIERATHELAREHRTRVVSSDGAEQIIVMGHGALRVSARAFEEEVNAVEKEIREFLEE